MCVHVLRARVPARARVSTRERSYGSLYHKRVSSKSRVIISSAIKTLSTHKPLEDHKEVARTIECVHNSHSPRTC